MRCLGVATMENMELQHGSVQDAPASPGDQELIAAINRGDLVAFEALYFRYRDWVIGVAFRIAGDHALALDVLQETFLYLLGKFPGFGLTSSLRTFLYPAIRHLAIAAREKAKRTQATGPDWETLDQLPASEPASTSNETLAAVLATLPEEHREVLLLRFVDDLELAEIAEALRIPLGTVKSRLHNGLRRLRENEKTRKYFE